jgi:hypothetical protein
MSDPEDPKSFDPRFPADQQPSPEEAAAPGEPQDDQPPPVVQPEGDDKTKSTKK